jgi:tetratricopeptide (TPR) repeat protein
MNHNRGEQAKRFTDEALARLEAGEYDAALTACAAALASEPEHADALHLTAYLHYLKNEHETALPWFDRAARAAPGNAEILNNWAGSLKSLARLEEAEPLYRRAIQLDPGLVAPRHNLAETLFMLDRTAEALAQCHAAIDAGLEVGGDTYRLLGEVLDSQGRAVEAIQAFRKSATLGGSRAHAEYKESMVHLRAGDYEQGWRLYESRLDSLQSSLTRWKGTILAKRTLLIRREQGLGDEVMFAACFPDLIETGARCLVICEPRLHALFARSFPSLVFFSGTEAVARARRSAEKIDYEVAAGSLPGVFRSAAREFPKHEGYLRADPARVEHWRTRLAAIGHGPKIGLSWRGGTPQTGIKRRTVPLPLLEPLLCTKGVHWISLQWEREAPAELAASGNALRVHHWPEALADYDETAALLCALDLSVSATGSVVHLAGALGRPVWVMVPWLPEWRYGSAGEAMPWYPCARLFRQDAHSSWAPVIEQVSAELAVRFPA